MEIRDKYTWIAERLEEILDLVKDTSENRCSSAGIMDKLYFLIQDIDDDRSRGNY